MTWLELFRQRVEEGLVETDEEFVEMAEALLQEGAREALAEAEGEGLVRYLDAIRRLK